MKIQYIYDVTICLAPIQIQTNHAYLVIIFHQGISQHAMTIQCS